MMLGKARILIVDDEADVRKMLKNCIHNFIECDIYECQDGDEALEKMVNMDFDLVILDVKMPGLSGMDVMEKVKELKNLPDTIILTAWDSIQIAQEVIRTGATDYIPKPVIADTIKMKIKDILSKKGKYFPKEEC